MTRRLTAKTTLYILFLAVFFNSCKKKDFNLNLITLKSTQVKQPELTLTNNIYTTVRSTVVDHNSYMETYTTGFCWALHTKPTLSDFNWSQNFINTGPFEFQINDLLGEKEYFIRPFISYKNDTIYGTEISVTTPKMYEKKVGDNYQGGKIAYIFQPNDPLYKAGEFHGIIVPPTDQSNKIQWSGGSISYNKLQTSTEIGSGNQNTLNIMTHFGTYPSQQKYAAKICNDLVLNGYSDWFLPSLNELKQIMKYSHEIGGFTSYFNDYYWSSSGLTNFSSAYFVTLAGFSSTEDDSNEYNVRAARLF